jgi:hypothetical protein
MFFRLQKEEKFLLKISCLKLFLTLFIMLIFDFLFEDYDKSALLLLDKAILEKGKPYFLSKSFIRWDSFFFIKIAIVGYEFDKNHAFFPLYPFFLKAVNTLTFKPFFDNAVESLFITSVFLNVLFMSLNTILFYRYV